MFTDSEILSAGIARRLRILDFRHCPTANGSAARTGWHEGLAQHQGVSLTPCACSHWPLAVFENFTTPRWTNNLEHQTQKVCCRKRARLKFDYFSLGPAVKRQWWAVAVALRVAHAGTLLSSNNKCQLGNIRHYPLETRNYRENHLNRTGRPTAPTSQAKLSGIQSMHAYNVSAQIT